MHVSSPVYSPSNAILEPLADIGLKAQALVVPMHCNSTFAHVATRAGSTTSRRRCSASPPSLKPSWGCRRAYWKVGLAIRLPNPIASNPAA